MKRIYFIDSENVGDSWLPLLVREEDDILVFYTSKSPYMSYDGLVMLKESPKKVTFIKCFEGTNALDFQLCSELGYRLNSEPAGEYIIITNDTGYDAAVRYWQKKNYPVRRVQSKMVKTLLEPEKKHSSDTARNSGKAEKTAVSLLEAYAETAVEFAAQDPEISAETEIVPAQEKAQETGKAEDPVKAERPGKAEEPEKVQNSRRARRKNNGKPAADRIDETIEARIAEVGRDHLKEEKLPAESQKAEPQKAEPLNEEPQNVELQHAEPQHAEPQNAETQEPSADQESTAPKKLSRREQWKLRQQARRQKQKELAQAYAEKTADLQADNFQAELTAETAADTEMAPKADTVAAVIHVETRTSGVQVIPPAFYTPAEPQPVKETAVPETAEEPEAETPAAEDSPAAEESPAAEAAVAEATEESPAAEAAEAVAAVEESAAAEAAEAVAAVEDSPAAEAAEAVAVDEQSPAAEPVAEVEESPAAEAEEAVEDSPATEAVAAVEETPAAETTVAEAAEDSPAAKAAAAAEPETAVEESPALPEYTFNKAEVDTLINCIGKNNLGDIHNSLELFYGEQGKEIYQTVKSNSYSIETKKWNRERKFKNYCKAVFAHSDWKKEEIPDNFEQFLYKSEEKRKNLNSLRAALQSEFGKDPGMRLYSLFKAHIKVLNRM